MEILQEKTIELLIYLKKYKFLFLLYFPTALICAFLECGRVRALAPNAPLSYATGCAQMLACVFQNTFYLTGIRLEHPILYLHKCFTYQNLPIENNDSLHPVYRPAPLSAKRQIHAICERHGCCQENVH